MRIRTLEYSNFRNFKETGKVTFSTDGRVTIIYGKNGDGKTTLHQLFQWILYNQVHFNKTASDKMYNLEFEREAPTNKTFSVWGKIDFEHEGEIYCVRREYVYKKEMLSSVKVKEEFSVRQKIDDDWGEKISRPQDFINMLLPPGLSEYFFFDGESMIADLNQLGVNSAEKLKTSLYTIFDLDKYQQAIDHIGTTELKTTVLGKLFIDLGKNSTSDSVTTLKQQIDGIQTQIDSLTREIEEQENIRRTNRDIVREISEKIGARQSKEALELQRKEQIQARDGYLSDAKAGQLEFGNVLYRTFPKALLHKKMQDAKKHIQLKIDKEELTPGINRTLLDHILNPENEKCICGRPLYHEQIDRLMAYYKLLPPDSYKSLYDNFTRMVNLWGGAFERDKVEEAMRKIVDSFEKARKCDQRIAQITEEQKASKDIEKLVKDRQAAEEKIANAGAIIEQKKADLSIYEKSLKVKMKQYRKETEKSADYNKYANRIDVMERVRAYYEELLTEQSSVYSKKLGLEIQSLINTMLTSERRVAVSTDFLLKVSDSFDDESKSEGQFAIVSFAYIGGILRMLSKDDTIVNKEYPLVLDGPFSKLDPDQRQNVIDTIPSFAPQVILFSKDDLTDCFEKQPDMVGRVWTIESNAEKNVATVEEGYRWTK